jgi:hypothetical protein
MKLCNLRGQNIGTKLFWSTPTSTMDELKAIRIPAIADGRFHTYTFDLFSSRAWVEAEQVSALRLDPYDLSFPGLDVAIDYIRLKTELIPSGR